MTVLNPGPLMIDVEGCQLTIEDRELIAHPRVGGIVLFTRNYENPAQLQSLIADIRSARNGALLVAVDHEGGRVQRFRAGFTRVPPMRLYGELFDHDASEALQMLTDTCRLVAFELAGCDIDFTFAPCIDIDHSLASVIGDRALHSSVDGVVALGKAAGTDLALICNDRAAASVACDNDEIPLGGEAQVRRRLNMRRSTPVRELRDGERNSILSKLLLLSHQPAC